MDQPTLEVFPVRPDAPTKFGVSFTGEAGAMFVLTCFAVANKKLTEEAFIQFASFIGYSITPTDLEPTLRDLERKGLIGREKVPGISGGMPVLRTVWFRIWQ